MTISRAGDVAWWQMTKENKLASLVVTFCSLIQIILVLLIAVKNSNQLLCSKHWSIFRRSHLSGINFTTLLREKKHPFSSPREKNAHLRPKDLLIFTCMRPCVANTELARSGACYWWRIARHGAQCDGTAGAWAGHVAAPCRDTWRVRARHRRRHAQTRARHVTRG